MTPEERKLLSDLADKVSKIPPPQRDPDAEDFIRTHIGNRPDALYLMTQTVIVQDMAIQHAQQEIEHLKSRLAQAPQQNVGGDRPSSPGFLPAGAAGWQQPQPPPQYQQPPSFQNPQGMQPAPGMQSGPGYAPPPPAAAPSGMGSFLRTAGTTAAGVAAGALAFEGIRSMFGGVEHMLGFGNQPHYGGGSFLADEPRETVVNNYYENPQGYDRDRDDRGTDIADQIGPDSAMGFEDSAQDDTDQYDSDQGDSEQDLQDVDDSDVGDDGSVDDSSYDDSGDDQV
ncbi:MAG: DUF2076 domain-containing protein [Acidobacteriaceae bacterium]|nr:DUF2076 domain-containing protein [Acidobacteriaceae bacterium]